MACEAQVKAELQAGRAVAPVDALFNLNHSERVSCLILYMQTATCLDNPSRMYAPSGMKKNLDSIQSYLRSGQRSSDSSITAWKASGPVSLYTYKSWTFSRRDLR